MIRTPRARRFQDRHTAGQDLGAHLASRAIDSPIVVALPRGGVPVGYEVARALGAPLDIGIVRKLGAPQQPELGIGAVGEDGAIVADRDLISELGVDERQLAAIVERERAELERRRRTYRDDLAPLDVNGRNVVLVDDGIATGVTAVAAAHVLRERGAASVIAAVPVCPADCERRIGDEFDEIICLQQPSDFGGVGAWYQDFAQTTDDEVVELLRASRGGATTHRELGGEDELEIRTRDGAALGAALRMTRQPRGVVIFVHGSGSSRHSPRNVAVARYLTRRGYASLLFDLLTPGEAGDREKVFDIELLARRLADVTAWTGDRGELGHAPIAYFGASTGAAAALRAAAERDDDRVAAVISRGGRPDLAGEDALQRVRAPTLLIVGEDDVEVLGLNESAATSIRAPVELTVIPRAGHLFEEPGALEQVSTVAAAWLDRHLPAPRDPAR